ncbi:hypothetical protein C8R47DRAFT_1230760 [Mycena vitilis]|nr:hypothetical protein C8R47DRAFT_1231289 [Mycena vitilis]KAJ6449166.1 hypothetical protein C8R47DRAFT_1230760 [Mycena vitilis]
MTDPASRAPSPPLIPTCLEDLEVKLPPSAEAGMLMELAAALNRSHFTFSRCPYGHRHYFQFEDGEGLISAIGTYSLRCPGPTDALTANRGALGQRCSTQYGRFSLGKEQVEKLLTLRDKFKNQADGARKLNKYFKKLDGAIAKYYFDGPSTPLPPAAAAWISSELETARVILERIDTGYIPEDPEVVHDIDELPQPDRKWNQRIESDDCNSDGEYDDTNLCPTEESLPMLFPTLEDGTRVCHLRVAIFHAHDTNPYHAMLCVPNMQAFRFRHYPLPVHLSKATFSFYVVSDEEYVSVPDTIDLTGRGGLLVFVQSKLVLGQSWLSRQSWLRRKWEERARDLAGWEEQESFMTFSSPPPSSSSSPVKFPTTASIIARNPLQPPRNSGWHCPTEADGARAGSAGKTPQPQGSPTKGKGKEIETPPRKKAKRTTNNLTPAVPSKQASTKQSKDVEVCLFFEADKEAIRLSDTVPDMERFEFTQHKIFDFSNALATVGEPTVYVRYSPHFGDFRSVQESRHLTDGQCPGLEKLKFEVHMLSNCASNEYPSFSIAGPSTLKRTRQVMEEDEDDDGDANEVEDN